MAPKVAEVCNFAEYLVPSRASYTPTVRLDFQVAANVGRSRLALQTFGSNDSCKFKETEYSRHHFLMLANIRMFEVQRKVKSSSDSKGTVTLLKAKIHRCRFSV